MDTATLIGIVISVCAVLFSILSWSLNFGHDRNKDTEQRVIERTEMNCKLDMINNNVVDIKNDNAKIREELKAINDRVVVVEQSVKSAHHRIDGMDNKQNAST